MKMKRFLVAFLVLLVALLPALAASSIQYVSVQKLTVKKSPSFFSSSVTTLAYGSQVTVVASKGKWSQVKSGNTTGWVNSASLTKKKIASSGSANASAKEISLAGKGFSQEIENEYKKSSGTDYASVDKMEKLSVSDSAEKSFLSEGSLKMGDEE